MNYICTSGLTAAWVKWFYCLRQYSETIICHDSLLRQEMTIFSIRFVLSCVSQILQYNRNTRKTHFWHHMLIICSDLPACYRF